MKSNCADVIKAMRKEMGLSQEDMAEQMFISVRQLARLESGEASMDIWQFITTSELLGAPTEDFWLLFLDSGEYAGYRDYKRLKRQLSVDDWSEAKKIVADFETSLLMRQPMVKQFIEFVKISIELGWSTSNAADALLEAMRISKTNFDESKLAEYRMTYNEIHIAIALAHCFSATGEHDKAISMVQAMIDGRKNIRATDEDSMFVYPALYYALAWVLGAADRHKEALKACEKAVDACREYSSLRRIPEILFFLAKCYQKLGEEQHIIKTHLVRAYHVAYGIGRNDLAVFIKDSAHEDFNVII